MDSHPFFLAVLDGLEAAALGNTVSQQILQIFLEPKKSKHYSQENEIALDIYNIIIVYRKRDRQQLMHTSSYRLHVDSKQLQKIPKSISISSALGYLDTTAWLPLDWSTTLRSPQKLRNIEKQKGKRAKKLKNLVRFSR